MSAVLAAGYARDYEVTFVVVGVSLAALALAGAVVAWAAGRLGGGRRG